MTKDEAHMRLDAMRNGFEAMTQEEIWHALVATGDLMRPRQHQPGEWPEHLAQLEPINDVFNWRPQ